MGRTTRSCKDNGIESVRTESGILSFAKASIGLQIGVLNKFILENEVPELLEKRIHQGNIKQFLEDNPALLPAGLNCEMNTVTVQKEMTDDGYQPVDELAKHLSVKVPTIQSG